VIVLLVCVFWLVVPKVVFVCVVVVNCVVCLGGLLVDGLLRPGVGVVFTAEVFCKFA